MTGKEAGAGHLGAHAGQGNKAETAHGAGAVRACEAVNEHAAAADKGWANKGEERREEAAHGAARGVYDFPPRRHVEAQVSDRLCAVTSERERMGEAEHVSNFARFACVHEVVYDVFCAIHDMVYLMFPVIRIMIKYSHILRGKYVCYEKN